MKKMNKVDMGLLNTISSTRGAFDCRTITDVSFVDVSVPTGLQNLHNERCYLVKKEDLEKKLAAAKSNEAYWRDRKEEEEDHHYYWYHTFDRAVKKAAENGVHIGIRDNDEECNAGIVAISNMRAEELEKQVVQMEDANQILRKRISSADGRIEELEKQVKHLEDDNSVKKARGDYWLGEHRKSVLNYHDLEQKHDKKWQAMTDALKDKGVEVIYMGEEDGKPIVDVKIPAIDILRKDYIVRGQTISDLKREIEGLKSRTLDKVEIRLSMGDIVWTYCDGNVHISTGIISADQIATGHINCLCKNHVDVDKPKCKSCAHYMHNPSRFTHDWCYKPVPKEGGAGYIRKLSKEEAEGPACSDFKARKE